MLARIQATLNMSGKVCKSERVLTLCHGGNLILDGQHQLGLAGQVLAAALLVLQGDGDAARQVVHAADDGRVSVRL